MATITAMPGSGSLRVCLPPQWLARVRESPRICLGSGSLLRVMAMDTEDRAALARLFTLVEADHASDGDPSGAQAIAHPVGLGHGGILIRDEAEQLLLTLAEKFAGHALAGGPAPSVIRQVLTQACYQSVHEGGEAGIATVQSFLANETTDWLVIAECRDLVHDREFNLGACGIRKELPTLNTDVHATSQSAIERIGPPVIFTTVTAFDPESALIIGRDRFAEARAILATADTLRTKVGAEAVVVRSTGVGSRVSISDDLLNSWTIVNSDREDRPLIPGYHELSEQAALPRAERSDWGRRVLAAARWYHRAFQTSWYSEAVSAAMSALETLLVSGDENKGAAVAKKTTGSRVLSGFDAVSQERWLKRLYRRRSGALHGGSFVDQDRDVERLLELTQHMCRWAVWHLNPFHRQPEASCQTQAEVFDGHLHGN